MGKQKAEAWGTCQVCGNFQKLPGNNLSTHGYTIQWGFFSGVCYGSHHLPLQVSCEMVKQSIVDVTDRRNGTLQYIDKLTKSPLADKAWINLKVQIGRVSDWTWRELSVGKDEKGYFYTFEDKTVYFPFYESAKSLADLIKSKNEGYVHFLRERVRQMDGYLAHQTEVVKNWKPTPVIPIKEGDNPTRKPGTESTRKTYTVVLPDGREEIKKASLPINFVVFAKKVRNAKWYVLAWVETEKKAQNKVKYQERQNEQYPSMMDYNEFKIIPVEGK